MNFTTREISQLASRGITPTHPNFLHEVSRVRQESKTRKNEDLQRRTQSLTKGQGFELEKEWSDPRAWQHETRCQAPTHLGSVTKIQKWVRKNSLNRIVFESPTQGTTLFETAEGQTHRWRRIL